MTRHVHIQVSFRCGESAEVWDLARKHRALLDRYELHDGEAEAALFLEDFAQQRPTGGIYTWAMIGNYAKGEAFAKILRPFWVELLSCEIQGAPGEYSRIIIFEEDEEAGRATAYEVGWETYRGERKLAITRHECPFAWARVGGAAPAS